MKQVKIALLGLGNVGSGVWKILNFNKSEIFKRCGFEIEIKKILVNDIKDCYVKMIEPTKLIEIAIMDEVSGYFYIRTDNVTPISGILSSTLYQTRMNKKQSERDIIGDVAARIIEKFDRKFLKDNPKFKKLIVEALNFYDLNQQAVTFQYIPKDEFYADYISPPYSGEMLQ